MADELSGCPFCGVKKASVRTKMRMFFVMCESCGSRTGYWFSRKQAIEAWNQRVVNGETSDGYHTFNELYHHRAVLFSKVVAIAGERAWKSKLHADGTMFDGYFIVGVETPEGQATYHYEIDPYWEMFDCKEMEQAPVWDGHTPEDAINRILNMTFNSRAERTCKVKWKHIGGDVAAGYCECGIELDRCHDYEPAHLPNFCPECGRKVVG